MTNLEKVLKNRRLTLALTGLTPQEFLELLPAFQTTLYRKRQQQYDDNPKRQRKPGGGSKGFLENPAKKLFFILFYCKCYPTYDVLSFIYDCARSNACRRQQYLMKVLEATLGKKQVLPTRQLKNLEEFFKAFPEAKEVFIDGTERPIQRPQDKQQQKANYSGKKKRHTRKNLLITTRQKRIGFLSKTVEGKQHDFTLLKGLAPPEFIPVTVRQQVDLGFKGYQQQYPEHWVVVPTRKPRNRELSKTIKEQNTRKSRVRVLVEHAIGGVKRLRSTTDVFRNRIKDSDDQVMLVACGLWNYHLAMSWEAQNLQEYHIHG